MEPHITQLLILQREEIWPPAWACRKKDPLKTKAEDRLWP